MVDLDMDIAMDCLIFLSAYFVINTQIMCGIWKAAELRQLSSTLTQEIELSNFIILASKITILFYVQLHF